MDDHRATERPLRDLTPDEVRRAFAAMGDEDEAGTSAEELGIETSADVQTNSGGNGSTD